MDERVVRVAADVVLAHIGGGLDVLHEIAEPHRPAIDECIGREKLIDGSCALVGRLVREERLHGGRIRNAASEIECDAAEELFVSRDPGRHHAVLLHLAEDLGVDEVCRRRKPAVRRQRRSSPASRHGLARYRQLVIRLARRVQREGTKRTGRLLLAEEDHRRRERHNGDPQIVLHGSWTMISPLRLR